MNFLKRKKLTSYLMLLMLILFSCNNQKQEAKIIEILSVIEIENENYHYSEESILKLKDKTYSIREKAIYKNGHIEELIVFKSEGTIKYDKENLKSDRKILENLGLPYKQDWSFKKNQIFKENQTFKVEKVYNEMYRFESENQSILYKIS